MALTLTQRPTISAGDVDMVSIDYTDYLDSSELLTGTPTVTEITTSALTFANIAVNTVAVSILNKTVAIGKAVRFKMSGQAAGVTYTVRVSAATDSSPARTVVRDIIIQTAS